MRKAVIYLLLLLAGCSTPTYDKAGATQKDFDSDNAACEADASRAAPPDLEGLRAGMTEIPVDVAKPTREVLADDCLLAKGWRKPGDVRPEPQRPDELSDDYRRCQAAMNIDHSGWDTSPEYAAAVREAQSHGLDIAKCQALNK